MNILSSYNTYIYGTHNQFISEMEYTAYMAPHNAFITEMEYTTYMANITNS